MAPRKKVRVKEEKRLPDWAKAIRDLHKALGGGTQEGFAARLHSKQGTVSTWLRGDETRKPSADMLIRMAGLVPKSEPKLTSRFLHLANVSNETILSVARKLETDQIREAAPLIEKGDIRLIPRYRETRQGREEAGPPVPLPSEFIPNPGSTICFVVDDKATAVVDSPKAVFILDESEKDAPTWRRFLGHVVFVNHPAKPESGPGIYATPGIYMGRLFFRQHRPVPAGGKEIMTSIWLELLTKTLPVPQLHLGGFLYDARSDFAGLSAEDIASPRHPRVASVIEKAAERALMGLESHSGCKMLGAVLGRLKFEGVENA